MCDPVEFGRGVPKFGRNLAAPIFNSSSLVVRRYTCTKSRTAASQGGYCAILPWNTLERNEQKFPCFFVSFLRYKMFWRNLWKLKKLGRGSAFIFLSSNLNQPLSTFLFFCCVRVVCVLYFFVTFSYCHQTKTFEYIFSCDSVSCHRFCLHADYQR
jgi:hypothetical protein